MIKNKKTSNLDWPFIRQFLGLCLSIFVFIVLAKIMAPQGVGGGITFSEWIREIFNTPLQDLLLEVAIYGVVIGAMIFFFRKCK